MHRSVIAARAVPLALAAACAPGIDPTPWCSATAEVSAASPVAAPTYHRDVGPIFAAKCVRCHASGGIGPFPLETYGDVRDELDDVRDAIVSRRMPPFLAAPCCRDYLYDYGLTDGEIATVIDWIGGGAPEGDPADAPPPPPPAGGLSRTDVVLEMPEPYTPVLRGGRMDDMRCFLLDWPREDRAFVTGLDPMPGNRQIVHHLVVAAIDADVVPRYEARDREDDGPGFDCAGAFGGLDGIHILGGSLVGSDFPRGIGREVRRGSKILLNMHYFVGAGGTVGSDQTRIALRLDPDAREMKTIPVANPAWLVGDGMLVEAGDRDAAFWFRYHPTLLTRGRRVALESATPHMHYFGSRFVLRVIRESGERECLVEIDDWDFGWEQPYWLAEPVILEPDDEVYIECHFDNSRQNQPVPGMEPRDFAWGDSNQDMCAGFVGFTELD